MSRRYVTVLKPNQSSPSEYDSTAMSSKRAAEDGECRLALADVPLLGRVPYLSPENDIPRTAGIIASLYRGQFCFATSFDPEFLARLMFEGFLVMAMEVQGYCFVTPKLHAMRCILVFSDLHIPKKAKKRSHGFFLTVDHDFRGVVQGCLTQHGESWLHAPLVQAFLAIYDAGKIGACRMLSFEIWKDEQLVAGEIGYLIGSCYTSLTGFSLVDSTGTIQCVATAQYLKAMGISFWDLGMELPYKLQFGAKSLPRESFLKLFHAARGVSLSFPTVSYEDRISSRSVICAQMATEWSLQRQRRTAEDVSCKHKLSRARENDMNEYFFGHVPNRAQLGAQ